MQGCIKFPIPSYLGGGVIKSVGEEYHVEKGKFKYPLPFHIKCIISSEQEGRSYYKLEKKFRF